MAVTGGQVPEHRILRSDATQEQGPGEQSTVVCATGETGAVLLVESESSEDNDFIWITVDEVAGESSQPQEPWGEEEGEGRKRQKEREEPMFGRQDHGGDKIKNWSLRPKRPILIMGDSNMARLPVIFDDRVQVECYPGAHWFHAHEILRNRTPTTDEVTAVILSFGINDRTYAEAPGKPKYGVLGEPLPN